MTEGAATDTFEVVLINLPTETAEQIRAAQAGAPVTVTVHLGYFDDLTTRTGDGGLVLVGRVTRVSACVGEDGYARTVLYGQEQAGYLLRNTPAAGQATGADAVRFAKDLASRAGVQLAVNSTLPGDLTGFTLRTGSTLDALRALAERADVPLVVRDGNVYLGAGVVGDSVTLQAQFFNLPAAVATADPFTPTAGKQAPNSSAENSSLASKIKDAMSNLLASMRPQNSGNPQPTPGQNGAQRRSRGA